MSSHPPPGFHGRRKLLTASATAVALSLPLGLTAVGATTAAAAAVQCSVDYKINNDWGSGFTTELTLTNRSATALDGWTLTYDYSGNQQLTNGWNGTWTQSGKSVRVAAPDWSKTVAAARPSPPAPSSATAGPTPPPPPSPSTAPRAPEPISPRSPS